MDEIAITLYGIIAFFIGFYNAKRVYDGHLPDVYRTEDTKSKVIQSLQASGLDATQTYICMAYLKNRGILFFESAVPNNVVKADIGKGSIG